MPPRLPVCALHAQFSPSNVFRAFSSTPAFASPPREPPRPQLHHQTARPPTPSSSSNLLSVGADRRRHTPNVRTMRPGEAAASIIDRLANKQNKDKLESIDEIRNNKISTDYLRQMPRRWDVGDVYSPHDLSPVEMQKWRKRSLRSNDVVDALAIRPLDMYKNFSLVQEFTTSSGQIIHSAGTSLRPVNQRKIAKMIRRVQGMGLYPTIHDHPEMIRDDFFPEKK